MGHFWRGGPGEDLKRVRERDPGRRPQTGPRRNPRERHCPRGWWPKVFKSENANLKFISRSKTKTTPRTPRESSPIVSRGRSYNLKSASGTNDKAPRPSWPRVRPKKNMKLHHPSIPDRQGPSDEVSPNHHGHRSRSHNDKRDKVWSNLWTPKSENSKPTSGHLKVKF